MAFDEKGQADTFARKTEICQRAYDLLVGIGFPPEDIVFDPNIFAIATGIEEHDNYAVDFIEACKWIRANLPHAKISGGVSNVSFSFRGNDPAREAIHTVFLYHAVRAGLTMGIVKRRHARRLRRPRARPQGDGRGRRAEPAVPMPPSASSTSRATLKAGSKKEETNLEWRAEPVEARLSHALVHGITQWIVEDTEEMRRKVEGRERSPHPRHRRPADGRHERPSATASAPARCSCRRSSRARA